MYLSAIVFAAFALSLASAYHSLSVTSRSLAGDSSGNRDTVDSKLASDSSFAKDRIHTIVVGSSHGELGFAAPECPELTYNLSFESQDLWYDCQLVNSIAPQLPNLRRVVFCVSAFSFRYSICDTDSERWREAMYFHACGIRSRQDDGDERRYSSLALVNSSDTVALLKSKFNLALEPLQGWRPLVSQSLDPAAGKLAAQRHQAHSDRRVRENQALLASTIRACRHKGLECLLISLPTHASYRDHLAPDLVRETRHLVEQISEQTGAAYLDYTSDNRFLAADFYDGDHLNESGARRFAQIFRADEAPRLAARATDSDPLRR